MQIEIAIIGNYIVKTNTLDFFRIGGSRGASDKQEREKIMNIFTTHTREQGVTYVEHLVFALRIATRLFGSVIAFTLHAIFPFIGIRKELDLEATAAFILEQNDWIESREKPARRALAA